MAYLNEDGLETLVGKIKGQVIELTSAEYRQLPATKNSDNKLYFVNDEAYAYQIDDEPTSGSSGLVKSGGVYNWTSKIGSGTLTTTAQTIIPAVNEVNAKIGSTDISAFGDGSLTGAVGELMYEETTITDTLGITYRCKKYANGDIEAWGVGDLQSWGADQGPYNGMHRMSVNVTYSQFTSIEFATANGTNSCAFIASAQVGSRNSVSYYVQAASTLSPSLHVTSCIYLRGKWK